MGVTEKMWDGISRVIRMDAKIETLATAVKEQQTRIEDLTGRVIRLETALELAMIGKLIQSPTNLIENDGPDPQVSD